jgi:hypothetical protein
VEHSHRSVGFIEASIARAAWWKVTRDEIIDDINRQLFSVRMEFYDRLDQAAVIQGDSIRRTYTLLWPHALSVIGLDVWNACYMATKHERTDWK